VVQQRCRARGLHFHPGAAACTSRAQTASRPWALAALIVIAGPQLLSPAVFGAMFGVDGINTENLLGWLSQAMRLGACGMRAARDGRMCDAHAVCMCYCSCCVCVYV
jgi:hypothetical protein